MAGKPDLPDVRRSRDVEVSVYDFQQPKQQQQLQQQQQQQLQQQLHLQQQQHLQLQQQQNASTYTVHVQNVNSFFPPPPNGDRIGNPALCNMQNAYAVAQDYQVAATRKCHAVDCFPRNVMCGEGQLQGACCDATRSESSCSSLSSADDGLVVPYCRTAGSVGAANGVAQVKKGTVETEILSVIGVPLGWKRLLNNGEIIYVSPSDTALNSLEQIKDYLLTPGSCKCGLECPLKCDLVFNFDPKVLSKPQDFQNLHSSTEDMTKLCNHKRKVVPFKYYSHIPSTVKHAEFATRKRRKYLVSATQHDLNNPLYATDKQLCQQEFSVIHKTVDADYSSQNVKCEKLKSTCAPSAIGNELIARGLPCNASSLRKNVVVASSQCFPVLSSKIQKPDVENEFCANQRTAEEICGNENMHLKAKEANVHRNPIAVHGVPDKPVGVQKGNNQMSHVYRNQSSLPLQNRFVASHNCLAHSHFPFFDKNMCGTKKPAHFYEQTAPLLLNATAWPDDALMKKKTKYGKSTKRRQGGLEVPYRKTESGNVYLSAEQVSVENNKLLAKSNASQCGFPNLSFLEDPSGYLAQQTALLNSTINQQTGATSCVSFTSSTSVQSVAAVDAVKYTHSPQNHGVSSTTACSQAFSRYVNKDVMVETNCPAESNVIPASAYISIAGYENQQLNYPIDSIHSVEGKTVSCKGPYMHTQETTYTWSVEDCVSSTTHGSVVTKDPQKMGSPVQGALVSTSNELQLSPKDSETGDLNATVGGQKDPSKIVNISAAITTMASGRTVGSNTVTSVLAGRANTLTVSVNSSASIPLSLLSVSMADRKNVASVSNATETSRTSLGMVSNIISNVQLPDHTLGLSPVAYSSAENLNVNDTQLVIASSKCDEASMQPYIEKITPNSIPPTLLTPTNTSTMPENIAHVVSAVSQPTVLVNTLPGPFVIPSGVAMAVDNIHGLPVPQLVSGSALPQQIQRDGCGVNRPVLFSPETKKKTRKKKAVAMPATNLIPQASGLLMPQQSMGSGQGVNASPVMVVSNKTGPPAQVLMNSQPLNANPQQLLANAQPFQQLNLLQPLNLLNGTGILQQFPTIQQFIVPNFGGMVMNSDGTATILQDATMQLQLQQVNGHNILTPVQNNQVFNNTFAAPAEMIFRARGPQQNKLSPGNDGQFVVERSGQQLSPLISGVDSVSFRTNHLLTSTAQQGFMGQAIIVPTVNQQQNLVQHGTNQQNLVQHNTTVVQQQTTVLSEQLELKNHKEPGKQEFTDGFVYAGKLKAQNIEGGVFRKHSVSTQTSMSQPLQSVTSTFCQTAISSSVSPDTTTLSPAGGENRSPALCEAVVNTECPSLSSMHAVDDKRNSQTMAMVHCVSSSEPDLEDVVSQSTSTEETADLNVSLKKMISKKTSVAYSVSSSDTQISADSTRVLEEHITSPTTRE